MITKKHIDALVASKFDLLKSKDILKDNLDNLKKEIESDFNQLAELALPEVYTERFNYFKLDGTRPIDFRERVLEIGNDKFIMAGIRFRGLNINRPFISIAPNFEITDNYFSLLAELIQKEFSLFKPLPLQFQMPSECKYSSIDLGIDRYTIVGKVNNLLSEQLPERVETIELIEIKHIDFYENYLNEYKIFHLNNPCLIDEVKPESLEDLTESMSNQLLYKIFIDNKEAGIIAGSIYNYYGVSSVCILEEILYDTFKGNGLGVYVQREFIKKLMGRYELLWGTISSLNTPSLKTALRNGRRIEEIEYSLKL